MTRSLLFILLLATIVALADDRPRPQQATGAGTAQENTEAARGRAGAARPDAEKAQPQAKEAQRKAEAASGQPEHPQPPTEKAQKPSEEARPKTQAQGGTQPTPAQTENEQPQPETPPTQTDEGAKLTSVPGGKALGMSILGNQEAPKSLVIVPWKTSELGRSPGISPMLDDSRLPVDKEVFMRALRYYQIMSETKR